ncbi:MAG TPA: hypothetical protein VMZ28_02375 [Kofleriaceae bacterium]|nr:hypothetical protein [Kofleriaceae bacterium]
MTRSFLLTALALSLAACASDGDDGEPLTDPGGIYEVESWTLDGDTAEEAALYTHFFLGAPDDDGESLVPMVPCEDLAACRALADEPFVFGDYEFYEDGDAWTNLSLYQNGDIPGCVIEVSWQELTGEQGVSAQIEIQTWIEEGAYHEGTEDCDDEVAIRRAEDRDPDEVTLVTGGLVEAL